ncbi:hypothetical protein C5167_030529 [Papaver somniferum]|nr:hypothetical protein C5167_030529 [Papaver somniferum]
MVFIVFEKEVSFVKVIAATNRADVLVPALMRSGRLDRKIESPSDPVNTPDAETPKLGKPEGEDDEEPPLNEDDDDDLDDLDQKDEEPSISHLVLAQIEKGDADQFVAYFYSMFPRDLVVIND